MIQNDIPLPEKIQPTSTIQWVNDSAWIVSDTSILLLLSIIKSNSISGIKSLPLESLLQAANQQEQYVIYEDTLQKLETWNSIANKTQAREQVLLFYSYCCLIFLYRQDCLPRITYLLIVALILEQLHFTLKLRRSLETI